MTTRATCLTTIASSDFGQPQWVQLMPAGRFQGRDGRGPWVLPDPPAAVSASRRYAGANKIAIDYEHQTQLSAVNGQPAPAAGWITDLQPRADGIWGLVEWTDRATEHLRQREYRYLSPVFNHTRMGQVIRIVGASLTNVPNLELTALARAGETMDQDLSELRRLLDLPPDASVTAITDKVRGMLTARQSAQPDPTQWVPFETFQQLYREFKGRDQGVTAMQAEHVVDQAIQAMKLPPFLKDWGLSLCKTNVPAFEAFLSTEAGTMFTHLKQPIGPFGSPPTKGAGALSEEDMAVCRTMGLLPEELAKDGRN